LIYKYLRSRGHRKAEYRAISGGMVCAAGNCGMGFGGLAVHWFGSFSLLRAYVKRGEIEARIIGGRGRFRMARKKPKDKKKNRTSERQKKFIEARAKGKSLAQAAKAAGYSHTYPRQSGFQVEQHLRGRVPDLLEKHGLSEDSLIYKYLRPLLEAKETKFFQKDGKVKQKVNVADNGIRLSALRTAFDLHGSFAPRDQKLAAQMGVKMIVMDMPRPSVYLEDIGPTITLPATKGSPALKNGDESRVSGRREM
jgi:hypothetical protein